MSGKESILFWARRPEWDKVVSDSLPFGVDAIALFESELRGASSYLEFGAGSSTLTAVGRVPMVVSVESDRDFLSAVQRRCGEPNGSLVLLHADIGPTGPWGAPVLKSRIWRQLERWSAYPLAPWRQLGASYRADLVLVDGRFRVACALAVISRQHDAEWLMLFDDYAERPEYHIVEEFAQLVDVRGRMAAFTPRPRVDPSAAEAARRAYMVDWR